MSWTNAKPRLPRQPFAASGSASFFLTFEAPIAQSYFAPYDRHVAMKHMSMRRKQRQYAIYQVGFLRGDSEMSNALGLQELLA